MINIFDCLLHWRYSIVTLYTLSLHLISFNILCRSLLLSVTTVPNRHSNHSNNY